MSNSFKLHFVCPIYFKLIFCYDTKYEKRRNRIKI